MNKVFLLGRLTRDVDLKMSKGDKAYARTGLAVDRRFAEFLSKYFGRGTRVLIEGHVQTDSYEKNGVKHYSFDVIVDAVEFADGKKASRIRSQSHT